MARPGSPDDPVPGYQSCGTCQYHEPRLEGGEMAVECRRYPPVVTVLGYGGGDMGEAVQAWPQVQAGDWCGEYLMTDE